MTARRYTNLGQNGLSLDRDLVLPDFVTPSQKLWPPYEMPPGLQYVLSMVPRALPQQVEAWQLANARLAGQSE